MYDKIKCEYFRGKLVIYSMPNYISMNDKVTLSILLQKMLNYNPVYFFDKENKLDNIFFLNMKSAVVLFCVSAIMKDSVTLKGVCMKSYNKNYMWSEIEKLVCALLKHGDISEPINEIDKNIIKKYHALFDELFMTLKPFSFILGNFDYNFYSLNNVRFFSNCENSSDNIKLESFRIDTTEIMSNHYKGREVVDEDKIPIYLKVPRKMNIFRQSWTVCLSSPKMRFFNMLKTTKANIKKLPEVIDKILLSIDYYD